MSFLDVAEASDKQTQIGFLVLPKAEHPLRFALLREWLQWCNNSHHCNEHQTGKLPTRLLYIGNPKGSDSDSKFLKLILAKKIGGGKYIALSHCQGNLKKGEVLVYCTTPGNIGKREEGFKITNLPLTFQHAIKVI